MYSDKNLVHILTILEAVEKIFLDDFCLKFKKQ
jgi:hypothetical protein